MNIFKFWSKALLQYVAVTMGIALIMMVVVGIGEADFEGGVRAAALAVLTVYPHYLIVSAMIIVFAYGITILQTFFPIMVSLNATRRQAVLGVLGSMLGIIAVIVAIAAIIWKLLPGDISDGGFQMLPFLAGGLLLEGAAATALGAVGIRWGKLGRILLIVCGMVIGACFGFGMVLFGDTDFYKLLYRISRSLYLMPVLGAALYLASGIFAVLLTRKVEIRMWGE